MCVNTDTTNWFMYFKFVGISTCARTQELALKVSKLSCKHNDEYFENLWNTVSGFNKHHTCLSLFVLDNCEEFRSKYTPDKIRDDKEVCSFVDDVVNIR